MFQDQDYALVQGQRAKKALRRRENQPDQKDPNTDFQHSLGALRPIHPSFSHLEHTDLKASIPPSSTLGPRERIRADPGLRGGKCCSYSIKKSRC